MRTHKFALITGWLKHAAARTIVAAWLALVMISPALAQEAPSGGRTGSLLNLLFLIALAFFLVRSFRRRGGGGDNTRPGRWTRPDDEPQDGMDDQRQSRTVDRHDMARQTWDMLRSDTQERHEPTTPTAEPTAEPAAPNVSGFDETEFLEGAKLFFARFQQAREDGDFQSIRDFISDDIFNNTAGRAYERTEIMLLNARLMELKSENGRTVASVFYDAQLRIGEQGERTEHVRAVWEFSRDDSKVNALWVLETINRVDQ